VPLDAWRLRLVPFDFAHVENGVFLQECFNALVTVHERGPDGRAPGVNRLITLGASRGGHHVLGGDNASIQRQSK